MFLPQITENACRFDQRFVAIECIHSDNSIFPALLKDPSYVIFIDSSDEVLLDIVSIS